MVQDDEADIDAFVAEHLPALLGLARLLTRTEQDAEDLVQSSLLRAVAKWQHVTRADNKLAYVRRLMVNTHVSGRRKHRLETVRLSEGMAVDDGEIVGATDRLALTQALQALPTMQRAVLVLHFHLDMTAEEISRETGLKPSSVRSSLSRGVQSLRTSGAFARQTKEQTR